MKGTSVYPRWRIEDECPPDTGNVDGLLAYRRKEILLHPLSRGKLTSTCRPSRQAQYGWDGARDRNRTKQKSGVALIGSSSEISVPPSPPQTNQWHAACPLVRESVCHPHLGRPLGRLQPSALKEREENGPRTCTRSALGVGRHISLSLST